MQTPCRVDYRDLYFSRAYEAYASSLEPVSSIARRYGLDDHAFKYHVERYHPEFVEQRRALAVQHPADAVLPGVTI